MANNKINRIPRADILQQLLPNLKVLILTKNQFTKLEEIEPLFQLQTLEHLSLLDNPVIKLKGYREKVISKLPNLKVLDFQTA